MKFCSIIVLEKFCLPLVPWYVQSFGEIEAGFTLDQCDSVLFGSDSI